METRKTVNKLARHTALKRWIATETLLLLRSIFTHVSFINQSCHYYRQMIMAFARGRSWRCARWLVLERADSEPVDSERSCVDLLQSAHHQTWTVAGSVAVLCRVRKLVRSQSQTHLQPTPSGNIAFIHHEGRHTIRKVEIHDKHTMKHKDIQWIYKLKCRKYKHPTYHIKQWTQSNQ